MSDKTLKDLAKAMKAIDFTMLSTYTANGAIAARPMSNNGDVEYDGDSFFFTSDTTRLVAQIESDPKVSLGFTGKHGFWASVEGKAELIKEKASFAEHWNKDLDDWFEQGVDTPGLTLIKVHADKIRYWDKNDQGELSV